MSLVPVVSALGGDRNGEQRHCATGARFCVQLRRDGDEGRSAVEVTDGPADGRPRRVALLPATEEQGSYGIHPIAVREAGGAMLIGVERNRHTSFAGGGASARHLTLFRLEPGAAQAVEMLDVPLSGSASIRACFTESEVRARLDICHDDYEFSSSFLPDLENQAARPRFVVEARAQTSPGRRSRSEDSTAAPPLRPSDPIVWHDPVCTYTRIFSYDDASGRYLPNAPLPDCADYLDF